MLGPLYRWLSRRWWRTAPTRAHIIAGAILNATPGRR